MANIVAGTRSQPPTISTIVFVSRNCHLANSILQQQPPLACRIRRRYPILNPHKGHNLQLLAYQRPSFSRKQAARYNAKKREKTLTTRWRLRVEIAFRQIRYRINNPPCMENPTAVSSRNTLWVTHSFLVVDQRPLFSQKKGRALWG